MTNPLHKFLPSSPRVVEKEHQISLGRKLKFFKESMSKLRI